MTNYEVRKRIIFWMSFFLFWAGLTAMFLSVGWVQTLSIFTYVSGTVLWGRWRGEYGRRY